MDTSATYPRPTRAERQTCDDVVIACILKKGKNIDNIRNLSIYISFKGTSDVIYVVFLIVIHAGCSMFFSSVLIINWVYASWKVIEK